MPSSRQVRMTRTAISPRLAIRILVSMVADSLPASAVADEVPVRQAVADPDRAERVLQRPDLGAREPLLDPGEEPVVDVLAHAPDRRVAVAVAERDEAPGAEAVGDAPHQRQ